MARMKIEVQAARAATHGISLRDRLVGWLPRYAPYAAKLPWLMNLRDALPSGAKISEIIVGMSARRSLPKWRADIFNDPLGPLGPASGLEVVLFADTFNRYFEPENLDAAVAVLVAGGFLCGLSTPRDRPHAPRSSVRPFFS